MRETEQIHNGTKKSRLIQLARAEPFLSVEEIAATVETTPRYVRTALSEAGLSLTKLRRQRARKMSGRFIVNSAYRAGETAPLPVISAYGSPRSSLRDEAVRVAQITDRDTADLLDADATASLLEISRVKVGEDGPLFVSRLLTNKHLVVGETTFFRERPFTELLGLHGDDNVLFSERMVDIVSGDEYIQTGLRLSADIPIIRCGTIVIVDGAPVAVKYNYFDGRRSRLIIGYLPDSTIHIVVKERLSGSK